jgi:hypothetical protein
MPATRIAWETASGFNMNTIAKKWNALTPDQRREYVLRDKSMRDPRWALLVNSLVYNPYNQLTELQKESVPVFLNLPARA